MIKKPKKTNSKNSQINTGLLVLENKMVFRGIGIGYQGETTGEVCFNTSLTGYQEIISDPSYAGQIIQLSMSYTSGTSFTGDCAIDFLRFMESPNAGCMDPFAINFDPTATMDDGSCLYPGCTDPMAINFCSSCNVNDSLSCVYPSANMLPFCDDFESASLSTNGWTAQAGTSVGTSIQLTSANAIIDTVSIEFSGGDSYYSTQATEAVAFSDPDRLSTATICLDLRGSSAVDLNFSAELDASLDYRAWFRVKVEGSVICLLYTSPSPRD